MALLQYAELTLIGSADVRHITRNYCGLIFDRKENK